MVRLVFRPIPRFDDRFARQNRDGPPPAFSLASPCPGIVHHLSGPSARALPASRAGRKRIRVAFAAHTGLPPHTRAPLDSLVRVSRRVSRRGGGAAGAGRSQAATARGCGRPARVAARPQPRAAAVASLLTFHALLTLSRVLFIFPSRYLFAIGLSSLFSLGWGIPPAWSCSPKQLDSPGAAVRARPHGAVTSAGARSRRLGRAVRGPPLQHPRGFQTWMFPVHSPLLRESLLVLFLAY